MANFKWKIVNNFNIFFIEVCSSGYDWWEVNIDLDNGFRLTDKKGKLTSKPMMTHFNDIFRTMELLQSCTKPSIYATKGRNELNAQANTIETHRNAVGFFLRIWHKHLIFSFLIRAYIMHIGEICNCFITTMGFPMVVRSHLYFETAPDISRSHWTHLPSVQYRKSFDGDKPSVHNGISCTGKRASL